MKKSNQNQITQGREWFNFLSIVSLTVITNATALVAGLTESSLDPASPGLWFVGLFAMVFSSIVIIRIPLYDEKREFLRRTFAFVIFGFVMCIFITSIMNVEHVNVVLKIILSIGGVIVLLVLGCLSRLYKKFKK